jgi:hypothetical protein
MHFIRDGGSKCWQVIARQYTATSYSFRGSSLGPERTDNWVTAYRCGGLAGDCRVRGGHNIHSALNGLPTFDMFSGMAFPFSFAIHYHFWSSTGALGLPTRELGQSLPLGPVSKHMQPTAGPLKCMEQLATPRTPCKSIHTHRLSSWFGNNLKCYGFLH